MGHLKISELSGGCAQAFFESFSWILNLMHMPPPASFRGYAVELRTVKSIEE